MHAVLTITLDLNADTKADAHAAIGQIVSAFEMNDEAGLTFRLVDPASSREERLAAMAEAYRTGQAPPLPIPYQSSCGSDAVDPAPEHGTDLDADGLPHDARIHAPGKARNADGRWRAKRNVDDATREKVTAELRAIMAASAEGGAIVATGSADPVRDASSGPCNLGVGCDESGVCYAEAMGAPDRCPHDPVAASPTSKFDEAWAQEGFAVNVDSPAPPPPSHPTLVIIPPPPPPAAVAALFAPEAPAQGFGEFVDWLGDELSRGSVTDAMWKAVLGDLGLPGIAALDHRPDLVTTARQRIEALRDAGGAA